MFLVEIDIKGKSCFCLPICFFTAQYKVGIWTKIYAVFCLILCFYFQQYFQSNNTQTFKQQKLNFVFQTNICCCYQTFGNAKFIYLRFSKNIKNNIENMLLECGKHFKVFIQNRFPIIKFYVCKKHIFFIKFDHIYQLW